MAEVTKHFAREEVRELLGDALMVDSSPWRRGTVQTLVFEHDGAHWRVRVHCHHDDGLQLADSGITATRVHQVKKTVLAWVPLETPASTK